MKKLICCLASVTVLAAGCSGDTAPPPASSTGSRRPTTPPKPSPSPDLTDPAKIEDEIAYVYSPIGKRDPFRSIYDEFQQDSGNEQLTELQKFELDQLKLVGIVSRIATPYAMVEDPNGKGHTLTRGKLIGKNWGRVSQITAECVVIKEEYRDYTGRRVTNKTNKCIPKTAELELE